MATWLLDTSVFYWCRSTFARGRLRERAADARFVAGPSAPLEIMAGMLKPESFAQRKGVLESFVDLCGHDGTLRPDGDMLVASAFGLKREALDIDAVLAGVDAAINSSSPGELTKGVPDYVAKLLTSVKLSELRSWDQDVGKGFKAEMDAIHYEKADPVMLELVRAEGIVGKEADLMARLLYAMVITESPEARAFAIAGLAVRAGAIEEEKLIEASKDLRALAALGNKAADRYDGSLDGFIQIYRHYHGVTAIRRPMVGTNDCLDLEPLLYFRADDAEQRYVTGEAFWVTVVNLAFPDRAIDVRPIAQRPGDHPGPA